MFYPLAVMNCHGFPVCWKAYADTSLPITPFSVTMNVPYARHDPRRWWTDLAGVWKDTRLIVMTAQIAGIYAAILIPFKAGIPIIPGFVELRPANAIPVVASLLFGPAAAWGAGIGNLIGDCFGTLGPASVFGFWGNFFFGYIPYLLWGRLGYWSSGKPPVIKSWDQGLEYGVICLIASGVCAGIISWGVEWLGLLPFLMLAPAIFFNNIVMSLVLGPPLLGFLYPRVQRWHLLYDDMCLEHESVKVSAAHEDFPRGDMPVSGQLKVQSSRTVLDCINVSFSYANRTIPAIQHVSFSVAPGELVVVLGRSGSGKSTLCYLCQGLIPHLIPGTLSGTLQVCGQDTRADPVWKRAALVGLVFQDFETQLVGTTVKAELLHPLEYRNPPLQPSDIHRRIAAGLDAVGLEPILNRDPMMMSGGQRQRLVLASVLVQEPKVLILDEPGSDLDPAGRTHLRQTMQSLRDQDTALIMTEQDHEDLQLADRVIVLDHGQMVWEGAPQVLLRQPDLLRDRGIRPLALTECFEGLTCASLPLTVEEAWSHMEKLHLTLEAPPQVLDDTVRLGKSRHPLEAEREPLIRIEDVWFRYANRPVLQNLDFVVYQGEFVALLGENGSGKSTMARLLNGLLSPTKGRILINSMDTRIASIHELAKQVGLVFQNPDHQIFAETIWEEVTFGVKNLGYSEEEISVRVQEALEAVGLSVKKSRTLDPFSLRKGDRQRVAVASVLAMRPSLLVVDEPTTGLDAQESDRMMEMIRKLNQAGHTIIMITHSMRIVAEYAHRCLLLKDGQVVADGSPRDIFDNPHLVQTASLSSLPLVRFSQRWGFTLLTVEEVKASLKLLST